MRLSSTVSGSRFTYRIIRSTNAEWFTIAWEYSVQWIRQIITAVVEIYKRAVVIACLDK
jgi:hypothetical protein